MDGTIATRLAGDQALTIGCAPRQHCQQGKRQKPGDHDLLVKDVDGAGVEGVCAADSDTNTVKDSAERHGARR